MSGGLSHHYLPWILGFAFSVLVGHVFIAIASVHLWRAAGLRPDLAEHRPSPWQPKAVGLTERALFTGSILAGRPEFIGLWIGIKTVVQWSVWGSSIEGVGVRHRVSGREVYNNFLIGMSLSIAFAAAGGYGAKLLEDRRPTPALLLGVAVVAGTVALTLWISRAGSRYVSELEKESAGAQAGAQTT